MGAGCFPACSAAPSSVRFPVLQTCFESRPRTGEKQNLRDLWSLWAPACSPLLTLALGCHQVDTSTPKSQQAVPEAAALFSSSSWPGHLFWCLLGATLPSPSEGISGLPRKPFSDLIISGSWWAVLHTEPAFLFFEDFILKVFFKLSFYMCMRMCK